MCVSLVRSCVKAYKLGLGTPVALRRSMKTFRTLIVVAVAGFVAPLAFVGCATDKTNDSAHKRTTGEYVDDKVLVQKVKSALGDNDVYKFPDVKVNTYKGTVQLSGFVTSDEQKRKAEDIARNVQGVYNIQNNITLKNETERVRGTTDTSVPSTTTNRTTTNSTTITTPSSTTITTPNSTNTIRSTTP
jgi:hyperosmotically inducible periplasmic protein